jgi:hypothetical protein
MYTARLLSAHLNLSATEGLPVTRWGLLLLLLVISVLPWRLVGGAQDRPPGGDVDTGVQRDLAAMTLRPADLDALGLPGFGLANQSSLHDAEANAVIEADGDPVALAALLAAARTSGLQYRYVGSLLRPRVPLERRPSGLLAAEQRVSTAVTEFGTVAGAQQGFATLVGLLADQGGRHLAREQPLGDESVMLRSGRRDVETGARAQHLALAFRRGSLIGEVIIVDFANVRPDPVTAERLGAALLARITQETAETTTGLSMHVLRIAPLAPWIEQGRLRDFYVRLEGIDEVTFAQLVEAIELGDPPPEATAIVASDGLMLPQATYMFWTPVGAGDARELPLYVSWLDRYATAEQAAAALHAVTTELGPGYVHVRDVSRITARIGEESRAFAYDDEGDPAGTMRGYVMIARVGAVLLRVQIDGPDNVRRAGVEAVAARQAICLRVAEPCVPIPVLWALEALRPVAPSPESSVAAGGSA